MELFKLLGTIAIENTQANEDIDETTGKAEEAEPRISGAFKKIGAAVVSFFAVDKIKDFGINCINAAADAEAMASQFTQVFGDMEGQASADLKGIADSAGIMENRMKGSYTKIAAFAKTTGMDTAGALSLADRAMIAVADSAAFYDRSLEETTESLQSFLKGNFENDAALGLSCTEITRNEAANRLYGKSFIDLSESQKQLTLLQMVEDANALSGALGQAARESDTWTNQTGNLKQAVQELLAELGSNILPTAVDLVKNITGKIQQLAENMPHIVATFKEWSPVLAGVITALVTLKGLLAISTLVNALTKSWTAYKTANEGATVAQWLLNAAMSANPITIVVALIAGLVAAILVLWHTNEDFRNKVIELWNAIKDTVGNAINKIKTTISEGIETAKNVAITKLTAIKDKFNSIFEKVKSIVKNAIDKIKGFFKFEWSLPKLKLPHISIKGKFSLAPPSVPSFGIKWYKKAMDEPYMFTKPTVFGMNPMGLKGAGEAGDEVMIGKNTMLNMIRSAVGEKTAAMIDKLDVIISLLLQYLPALLGVDTQIVLDDGTLVGKLAPKMDEVLAELLNEKERGM